MCIRDRIEANWRKLCKKIDVSGLSFRAVESLALKALATDGEFMYICLLYTSRCA